MKSDYVATRYLDLNMFTTNTIEFRLNMMDHMSH